MRSSRLIRWSTVALLTTLLLDVSTTPAQQAARTNGSRPNILFIMSDDHGYQALSCYGSKVNETPNLDRIAEGGMRFDRCFVTNSICGPSRAVILTGKYSHLNGFVRNGNTFNGRQQTVAKLLRQGGYQTAMIGKWHLKSDPTGFDYWNVLIGQGPYYNPPMKTSDGVVKHTGYTTEIITDLALDWLKNKRDGDKPFLLMYQHKAPHRNWMPGPDYLDMYDDVEIPEPETLFDDYSGRGTAAKQQEMTVARHLNENDLKLDQPRGLTPEQLEKWNAAYGPKNKAFREANLQGKELIRWKYQRYVKDYLRSVAAVDDNVGRVLDYLDESGLADNTVVIYTSDQGWYLGEHGWYDKRWMYEESFRTPLMIRWPGTVKPGSTSDKLTLNLDFPETFLEIAGLPIPEDMQGRSLVPILKGQETPNWRDAVYYHYYEFPGPHSVAKHYGVRTDRYKLIHFYELDEWELYDLKKDPNEMQSVYDDPEYAEVVERMKAELKRQREKYGDDGSVVDFGAQRAKEVRLQQVAEFSFEDAADLESGKLTSGVQGKAVQLDGQNAVAGRPSDDKLDPTYKPITVGAWCRGRQLHGTIVAQGGASLGYSLYLDHGVPCFSVRAAGELKTVRGKPLSAGQWVHVAALLDDEGRGQIYVDGRPSGEQKQLGFVTGRPADRFSVGADTGSPVADYEVPAALTGQLDEVRVYWGELDEAQLESWAVR